MLESVSGCACACCKAGIEVAAASAIPAFIALRRPIVTGFFGGLFLFLLFFFIKLFISTVQLFKHIKSQNMPTIGKRN
jgi:flagellar biosynthesis protein FliP